MFLAFDKCGKKYGENFGGKFAQKTTCEFTLNSRSLMSFQINLSKNIYRVWKNRENFSF